MPGSFDFAQDRSSPLLARAGQFRRHNTCALRHRQAVKITDTVCLEHGLKSGIRQGLKPNPKVALCGTTEVVP
jgi:hypothetical protein